MRNTVTSLIVDLTLIVSIANVGIDNKMARLIKLVFMRCGFQVNNAVSLATLGIPKRAKKDQRDWYVTRLGRYKANLTL